MNQVCFISDNKLYNYYHGTEYGVSTAKQTAGILQSLLKVARKYCYNDYGKFKGIYITG